MQLREAAQLSLNAIAPIAPYNCEKRALRGWTIHDGQAIVMARQSLAPLTPECGSNYRQLIGS
jgi:hypothetical protein